MYDVVIIGSGIMGVTTARMLSRYKLNIAVLEKNYDIGEGSSKSNSGLLAAGFHPRIGSLKGISAVKGNEMYHKICRDLDVPVDYCGSLMVAYGPSSVDHIHEKYKKGIGNGAKGLKIISGDEAREMEPLLSKDVTAALYSPSTAIIDVFKLVYNSAQLASINGTKFYMNTTVQSIEKIHDDFIIKTNNGNIDAHYIVNTAGEDAEILERCFKPRDLKIIPRRGQFYVFEKQDPCPLKHVIYQAHEKDEGGCLISPTIDGNIIAGPNSEDVPSYKNTNTTREGLDKIERVAKKIIPDLDMSKVITSFAGLRANIKNIDKEHKDFIIRSTVPKMVSALGIKNPGITSAPYLCEIILDKLKEDGLVLVEDENTSDVLNKQKNFFSCSKEEQTELLKKDKDYGKIICRCEKVTLGDIKRILAEPLPPVSLDGIKKRLRVGMGKCQGGFCTPELLEILSKVWEMPVDEICKSTTGSELVKGNVK